MPLLLDFILLLSLPFPFFARCMIRLPVFIVSGFFTSDTRKCFDTGIMRSNLLGFFFRTKYSSSSCCCFLMNQMTYILLLLSNKMYILYTILCCPLTIGIIHSKLVELEIACLFLQTENMYECWSIGVIFQVRFQIFHKGKCLRINLSISFII